MQKESERLSHHQHMVITAWCIPQHNLVETAPLPSVMFIRVHGLFCAPRYKSTLFAATQTTTCALTCDVNGCVFAKNCLQAKRLQAKMHLQVCFLSRNWRNRTFPCNEHRQHWPCNPQKGSRTGNVASPSLAWCMCYPSLEPSLDVVYPVISCKSKTI